jgi:hypothetical protein
MSALFTDHREAAQAILRLALAGEMTLRAREGQFLGGFSFDTNPATEKQLNWLAILLDKVGLPALATGGAQ